MFSACKRWDTTNDPASVRLLTNNYHHYHYLRDFAKTFQNS
jgi:hypothetical protein